MLFRIELNLINPMNGKNKLLVRQFDPTTLDQTKWNSAWPAVQPLVAQMITDAQTNADSSEPAIW